VGDRVERVVRGMRVEFYLEHAANYSRSLPSFRPRKTRKRLSSP